MYQLLIQSTTLPILVSSMMGIMIHETRLDSAVSKIIASQNDVVMRADITSRMPHTHAHEGSMLEHMRSLNAGRTNAKRNKGENEKKYLIQKRNSSRTLTSDGTLVPQAPELYRECLV